MRNLGHGEKSSDTLEQDAEYLKNRTIIALGRLGQQKFSPEPGGYSLENWTKVVNLLLDDFEKRLGTENLTSEYVQKRRELTSWLSRPIDLTSIDGDISATRSNEDEIKRKLREVKIQTSSKIVHLKDELNKRSDLLEEKRAKLSSGQDMGQRSGSLLKRLFGREPSSSASALIEVEQLESDIQALSDEVLKQEKDLKSIERHPFESPWADDWKELVSLQTRLKGLEMERSEKLQLANEREELTTAIANAIVRISSSIRE